VTKFKDSGEVFQSGSAKVSNVSVFLDNGERIVEVVEGGFGVYRTSKNRFFGRGFEQESTFSGGTEEFRLLNFSFPAVQVTNVFVGGYHVFFLRERTTLYGIGSNSFGQLCLGHSQRCNEPQEVTYEPFVKCIRELSFNQDLNISSGASHAIFYFTESQKTWTNFQKKLFSTFLKENNQDSTNDLSDVIIFN